ncbi:acyl-CoA thioesterase [Aquicoccus porphyridii]|uniref:Acyl-CoA thioesterase n=1 Tax=Aquicoccus porphyridii TaxID=1852029 RepID=A0A5A9ZFN2_9RHOB|nr:acyl-CoA thioesterase [Aquicoccus porphyridii]KAA0916083.1 acyl-CoA thioesterase [Aquicoccus porphyridii]RAI52722.1 acyl-CoA thioesterase [Rhodobacteraceae bacterium AsT-22]
MKTKSGLPPFEHEIRVAWGDCDPARIAYTGRIPNWALDAINAWWEHHLGGDGWFQMELDRGYGTPFVHMSLDFRHVITPRHRLICKVAPTRLGSKSIEFRVEGYQDGNLCFEGRFVCVFIVSQDFTSRAAPPEIREMVEPLIVEWPEK